VTGDRDETLTGRTRSEVRRSPATGTGTTDPEIPSGIPQRIGKYHIRNVIGSGGMGIVYLASQEHPHRSVALKVLRREHVTDSAMRRFEFESEILARLRHPNIAQVYEAGTHAEPGAGDPEVPFFAMEYIPGAESLTEYANHNDLEVGERLALFEKVCMAVHHGHQRGIIHRDLKPGNILVDSAQRITPLPVSCSEPCST
jgi:serine/threonine protein kinase